MLSITGFVEQYDGSQQAQIEFAWNGCNGGDLRDANEPFRRQVLTRVLEAPDTVPVHLLRDLFAAETQWASHAWAIHLRLDGLATLLLTRGGNECLVDFLRGMARSADAYLACASVTIDAQLANNLLNEAQRLLQTTDDVTDKKALEHGVDFFRRYIAARVGHDAG